MWLDTGLHDSAEMLSAPAGTGQAMSAGPAAAAGAPKAAMSQKQLQEYSGGSARAPRCPR